MVISCDKIVHVQSVLMSSDVDALKKKTHQGSIKDAISVAVHCCLQCNKESCKGKCSVTLD